MHHRFLAATLLALGLGGGLYASGAVALAQDQAPAPQAPTFRAAVSLVRVDVSVSDRDGKPLVGLTSEDFEIREDNIPQKIETVQFVQLDGTRTSDLGDSLQIRSQDHAAVEAARDDVRLFAIFLDDYHVDRNPEFATRAKNALKELIRQLGPNDLMAIMDPLTPLSALRFTRSRDELIRRVDQFEGRLNRFVPPRSPAEAEQLGQPNPGEVRAGVTLSALSALVNHMGGLREGRKSVLFVSQGPPIPPGNSPNEKNIRSVLEAANRGNVTIHVFDPQPLGFSGRGGRDTLRRLQEDTGGRTFFNSQAMPDQMVHIVEDASAYYLVGYAPAREFSDGKFHAIEVRVRRDGSRVVHRNGYWAPTFDEMNPATTTALEPEVVAALAKLATPVGGRSTDVWIGTAPAPDAKTRVTVSWDPTDIADPRRPVKLTVEPLNSTTQQSLGELRALASSSGGTAATPAVTSFDLLPGSEVALRFEATTADGTVVDRWTQPLQVPVIYATVLGLGEPRVYRAQSAFEARALASAASPPPAANRQFRQSDRVIVEVDCYAPDGLTPVLTARLLNGSGEKLVELMPSSILNGKARITLPLASLAPSTYVLHVESRLGDQSAHRRLAFRIAR